MADKLAAESLLAELLDNTSFAGADDTAADGLLAALLTDTVFAGASAPETAGPSLAHLVGGVLADAQQLVRREFDLARQEVLNEVEQAKQGAIALGAGGGVLVLGGLLLVLMLVYAIAAGLNLPLWVSYLLVGITALVVGWLLLRRGLDKLRRVDLVPHETIETVKEGIEWSRN